MLSCVMKYFLLFVLLITASTAFAQTTNQPQPAKKRAFNDSFPREKFDPLKDPAADLAAAVKTASADGRNIILDVGGEWCVWCVIMDKYFYDNADLAKMRDQNFIWLKVNMSEENENKAFLVKYPPIVGYPHLFVLNSKGEFLHSQDTAPLESEKSYDRDKIVEFLKKWSPQTKAAAK